MPGPVSAMVSFELFVRPALRKMQGYASLFRRAVPVTLEEEVKINAKLTHFLRAWVTRKEDGTLTARLTGLHLRVLEPGAAVYLKQKRGKK